MKKTNLFNIVKTLGYVLSLFAIFLLIAISSCTKEEDEDENNNNNNTNDTQKMLVIENGAQTIQPDDQMTYSAVLVDNTGNVTIPTSITWTTTDDNVATINTTGIITIVGAGNIKITASVTEGEITYTASVPLGIFAPSLFVVAPSAILYEKGGSLQLEAVYLSTSGTIPSYSYVSSNSDIASVSNSGLVSFNAIGECYITVTATTLNGTPSVIVPVLVIGPPEITLPIIRVNVTPASKDLFKNETQQLSAKAYNSDGEEVSASFTWSSIYPDIATVSSSGLVTPLKTGKTYIQAITNGIIGQAEILVNPDTVVVVEPYYVSMAPGATQQFTATAYNITRTGYTEYSGINFDWMIPTYGISMFDIATVNNSGLVTMKSDATAGMVTFVVAYDSNNPYVGGMSMIMTAVGSDCDCGVGNPDVASIVVNNSTPINLTLTTGTLMLDVTAYDADEFEVTEPLLVFCSDNITVANVDTDGTLIPTGEGTATITICSGSYASTEVTVNVTMF
ncbi:MAG: Ig-like domain-containing protein [Bacteroidales bacterium]|nr:Ig-like domain-containing protein [Bacteroidales bacterium]